MGFFLSIAKASSSASAEVLLSRVIFAYCLMVRYLCVSQISHRHRQSLLLVKTVTDMRCYVRSNHNGNHPIRMVRVIPTPMLCVCRTANQCQRNYQYPCFPIFRFTHSHLYYFVIHSCSTYLFVSSSEWTFYNIRPGKEMKVK